MTVETRPRAVQLEDPRSRFPKAPQPPQEQDGTGSEQQMRPRPDYGDDTYVGAGKLTGLVGLVTGADSGIGRAVALAYAREGADVVISYLENDQDAEETRQVVEDAGRRAVVVRGDIGDETHCRELVAQALDELGRLDVLVNNAAYQNRFESIEDITTEEWRRTFRTNIDAMFFLCKAAIPRMKPGASIINTASVQAYSPSANLLAYATTKGAIVTYTKALAQMVGKDGIRVNAVAPGPIWTPLIPSSTPAEGVADFGKETVFGRPGQPVELAPVYVLLASPEASYITGTVYVVAGGMPLP
jgi:NAD(P)-dependent dehydrogenase (short-subunit alcohol dehydrogenase family)